MAIKKTYQNGGTNDANNETSTQSAYNNGGSGQKAKAVADQQNQYKQHTIQKGDTLWGLSRKYNTSVDNLKSWNSGVDPRALQVGNSLNVYGTGGGNTSNTSQSNTSTSNYMPNSYEDLMNPNQVRRYAQDQAQNKFQNEKLGYNQMIDRYNTRKNQLDTDQEIESEAQRKIKMKYAGAFDQLDANRRNAETRYENSVMDINNNYEDAIEQIRDVASDQRGNALASAAQRGLYNSSIVDQNNQNINENEINAIQEASTQKANNIAQIDNELNTLFANIDQRMATLTENQQAELVGRIDQLTEARDNEQMELNMMIDQQNQLINQSRVNMGAYENQLFQDMFGRNQSIYDQRDQFNRQMDLEREQMKYYSQFNNNPGGPGGTGTGLPKDPNEDPNEDPKELTTEEKMQKDLLWRGTKGFIDNADTVANVLTNPVGEIVTGGLIPSAVRAFKRKYRDNSNN